MKRLRLIPSRSAASARSSWSGRGIRGEVAAVAARLPASPEHGGEGVRPVCSQHSPRLGAGRRPRARTAACSRPRGCAAEVSSLRCPAGAPPPCGRGPPRSAGTRSRVPGRRASRMRREHQSLVGGVGFVARQARRLGLPGGRFAQCRLESGQLDRVIASSAASSASLGSRPSPRVSPSRADGSRWAASWRARGSRTVAPGHGCGASSRPTRWARRRRRTRRPSQGRSVRSRSAARWSPPERDRRARPASRGSVGRAFPLAAGREPPAGPAPGCRLPFGTPPAGVPLRNRAHRARAQP